MNYGPKSKPLRYTATKRHNLVTSLFRVVVKVLLILPTYTSICFTVLAARFVLLEIILTMIVSFWIQASDGKEENATYIPQCKTKETFKSFEEVCTSIRMFI